MNIDIIFLRTLGSTFTQWYFCTLWRAPHNCFWRRVYRDVNDKSLCSRWRPTFLPRLNPRSISSQHLHKTIGRQEGVGVIIIVSIIRLYLGGVGGASLSRFRLLELFLPALICDSRDWLLRHDLWKLFHDIDINFYLVICTCIWVHNCFWRRTLSERQEVCARVGTPTFLPISLTRLTRLNPRSISPLPAPSQNGSTGDSGLLLLLSDQVSIIRFVLGRGSVERWAGILYIRRARNFWIRRLWVQTLHSSFELSIDTSVIRVRPTWITNFQSLSFE